MIRLPEFWALCLTIARRRPYKAAYSIGTGSTRHKGKWSRPEDRALFLNEHYLLIASTSFIIGVSIKLFLSAVHVFITTASSSNARKAFCYLGFHIYTFLIGLYDICRTTIEQEQKCNWWSGGREWLFMVTNNQPVSSMETFGQRSPPPPTKDL